MRKFDGLKGELHSRSRLTNEQVMEIRQLVQDGKKQLALAHKFSVNTATISRVARGISWSHLNSSSLSED